MCVTYTSPGVAANTGGRNGPASSSWGRSPGFWFTASARANGGTSATAAYVKRRRRSRPHYCAIYAPRCAMHTRNGRTTAQQIRRPWQVGRILRQGTYCYVAAAETASGSRYHAYRRVGRSPHGIYSAVQELTFAIDLLNQDPDVRSEGPVPTAIDGCWMATRSHPAGSATPMESSWSQRSISKAGTSPNPSGIGRPPRGTYAAVQESTLAIDLPNQDPDCGSAGPVSTAIVEVGVHVYYAQSSGRQPRCVC
jgi:hypothetical protein